MAVCLAASCCYGHVLLLGLNLAVYCFSSSVFNSHPCPQATRLRRSTWRPSSLHAPLFSLLEGSEEQYLLSAVVVDKIAAAFLLSAVMSMSLGSSGTTRLASRFWCFGAF